MHHHALVHLRDLGDMFGGGKNLVDLLGIAVGIGIRSRPVDREIAGRLRPDLRRAVAQRFARVGNRRHFFVFDRDQLGGVLRRGRALRHHHRHRLADMHHPLAGQRRPVRNHQPLAAAPRQRRVPAEIADPVHVFRREHADHTRRFQRGRGVDADDAGKRVGRADEIGVGLVRQRRIGGIAAASAKEDIVFDADVLRLVMLGGGVHNEVPKCFLLRVLAASL